MGQMAWRRALWMESMQGVSYNKAMPNTLRGKSVRMAAGERICFAYNLGGCSLAPPGGKCPKGLHVCAEPGCEQAHGLKDHPAKFQ